MRSIVFEVRIDEEKYDIEKYRKKIKQDLEAWYCVENVNTGENQE